MFIDIKTAEFINLKLLLYRLFFKIFLYIVFNKINIFYIFVNYKTAEKTAEQSAEFWFLKKMYFKIFNFKKSKF